MSTIHDHLLDLVGSGLIASSGTAQKKVSRYAVQKRQHRRILFQVDDKKGLASANSNVSDAVALPALESAQSDPQFAGWATLLYPIPPIPDAPTTLFKVVRDSAC